MNAEPYEPSIVKEALCKHFNLPSVGSRLKTYEQRFRVSRGYQSHYYLFTLTDGRVKHRAFGKIAFNNEREYRALQYLMKAIPEGQRHFGRPITILKQGNRSLLLLEYLEGCSSPFNVANSLRLFPNRSLNITEIGKTILEKIYDVQRNFPAVYRPLSSEDTEAAPGQPTPTGVFKQLENVRSLSIDIKAALRSRIDAILKNETMSRRGVVHGALGMRNIMIRRSKISFIDWEFMQYEALSIYDPCYIATMVLMRGVQLCVPRSELDVICNSLFQHIEHLEDGLTETKNKPFVRDVLWFGKCLATIDTLWAYERSEGGRLKAMLGQKHRKIKYLAYRIEKEARNGESNCNASTLWQSSWDTYIKVSKRGSSSATVTAEKFIKMAGIRRGSRILDLGCGHGRITELIVEKVPSLDIVGVDMTRQLLDNFIVKRGSNQSNIQLVRADITNLPLDDNVFDAVISSRVFQYLPNPLLGLREVLRVVKPGGSVVIVIPNKLNIVKYFSYKQRLYSPFQVRDWFKVCGFEDIEYRSMGFFPSSRRWKRLAAFLEIAGKVPFVKYLGGNVLVRGKKKEVAEAPALAAGAADSCRHPHDVGRCYFVSMAGVKED